MKRLERISMTTPVTTLAGANAGRSELAELERRTTAALIRLDRQALEALADEAVALAARPGEFAGTVEPHRLLAAVLAHSRRNLRLLQRRHQARLSAAMKPDA